MTESQGTQSTILIVDDTPENFNVLRGILTEHGYRVCPALNGELALQILQQTVTLPDLILLDIMMPPGMDGYEVCRRLKADKRTRDIPVLFISALDATIDKVRAFEVGGVDYIPMPFQAEELLVRVGTHLALRSQQLRVNQLNEKLEMANRLIRETFGRYLSDEIVETILETPEGLKLGGEKRRATVMMTDLRGFTAIGERLPPEHVVEMLNIYLDVMTEIILTYHGTIDEFSGDAILAVF